jgi:hypothetical protein
VQHEGIGIGVLHACYKPRKQHQKLAFLDVSHSAFGAPIVTESCANDHPILIAAATHLGVGR